MSRTPYITARPSVTAVEVNLVRINTKVPLWVKRFSQSLFTTFGAFALWAHRVKIHSTHPLERLNTEVKRRANVVGIFPSEGSILRLVGAVLMEQNDDWIQGKRYLTLGTLAEVVPLAGLELRPSAGV